MSVIRKLFTPPFRHYHGCVLDARTEVAASRLFESTYYSARGWGRIQYLPDGDALFREWDAEFTRVAGGLTDAAEVARRLNEAAGGEP